MNCIVLTAFSTDGEASILAALVISLVVVEDAGLSLCLTLDAQGCQSFLNFSSVTWVSGQSSQRCLFEDLCEKGGSSLYVHILKVVL